MKESGRYAEIISENLQLDIAVTSKVDLTL